MYYTYQYKDYLNCYIHLMKHIDPKDPIWIGFAKVLSKDLEPFNELEFKLGGKVLKNNVYEYYEVFGYDCRSYRFRDSTINNTDN